MRPGLMIGAPHVIRYTVPVHQTQPNLLPPLLHSGASSRCPQPDSWSV
jgi:hypothetical protein